MMEIASENMFLKRSTLNFIFAESADSLPAAISCSLKRDPIVQFTLRLELIQDRFSSHGPLIKIWSQIDFFQISL